MVTVEEHSWRTPGYNFCNVYSIFQQKPSVYYSFVSWWYETAMSIAMPLIKNRYWISDIPIN